MFSFSATEGMPSSTWFSFALFSKMVGIAYESTRAPIKAPTSYEVQMIEAWIKLISFFMNTARVIEGLK